MSLTNILSGVNYGLLFFFGVFLSVSIAGGCKARRDWILLAALCSVSLTLQIMSYLVSGLDATKQICPLQLHLPLLAVMIFGLKRPAGISLVSICTAYLCCQLPRCAAVITVAASSRRWRGRSSIPSPSSLFFYSCSGILCPPPGTPWRNPRGPYSYSASCPSPTMFTTIPSPST